MPPRPKRAATKRARPATPVDKSDASDFEESPPKPPPKRARRGKNTKMRASIEKLVEMPLDFIYLLVCKLQPLDLLHMARSCRSLREFFMSRKSEQFWKAAAKNMDDLPSPPEGLSWPAYTAVMFSAVCHNCGKGGCDTISWDCLARYCGACKYQLSTLHTTKYDQVRSLEVGLPNANIPYPVDQIPLHCVVPVMETDNKIFHDASGILPWLKRPWRWNFNWLAMKRLQEDLKKLSPEQMFGYIDAKAKALQTRREQTPPLVAWKEENKLLRASERQQLQKARGESIKQKLTEAGWGEELGLMPAAAFDSHPLVAQPKALTDRTWKSIHSRLEDFLLHHQQDRLYRERGALVKSRLKIMSDAIDAIQPLTDDGPATCDIALGIPEIQTTLELPADITVTMASFDFLANKLPTFVQRWKDDTRKQLCDLVRAKVKLAQSTDPLSLAIGSRFRCRHCSCSDTGYPHLLSHRCHNLPEHTFEERDYCKELIVYTLQLRRNTPSNFTDEVPFLEGIVKLCGQDPAKATVSEMDLLPIRLTCSKHNGEGEVTVMTWSMMLAHRRQHYWERCDTNDYDVVPENLCEAARPLEETARKHLEETLTSMNVWQCTHCTNVARTSKKRLLAHLASIHGIESPSENDLFCTEHENPKAVQLLDESKRVGLGKTYERSLEKGLVAFVRL